MALEHARLAIRLQGDTRRTVMEFRKHLGWYVKGLPGSADLRRRLHAVESLGEVEGIFGDYLGGRGDFAESKDRTAELETAEA